MLLSLASALPRGAKGRVGVVLEGGYDLAALAGSLQATIEALDSGPARCDGRETGEIALRHERDLADAMAVQRPFWRGL